MWAWIVRVVAGTAVKRIAGMLVAGLVLGGVTMGYSWLKTNQIEKQALEMVELRKALVEQREYALRLRLDMNMLDELRIKEEARNKKRIGEVAEWKQKYKELRNDPEIREWADTNYPSELD